ncbi:MAG: hypothetical protein JW947_02830 [Sedimentisphaerales bacterium]|nr:hypothetical protein [Sedimentisphaerales bacterium]
MNKEIKNQDARQEYLDLFGLPVDTAVLFSNHENIYSRRVEKRQRKLLAKISFIHPFLHEGEKILHVTTGCSPMTFMEQFLTGGIVFYLKRALFVFTNMRIFHIPAKQNLAYRYSIAQILYSDCRKIYMQRSKLVVEYKNGKSEQFFCIDGREKKKLKALLEYATTQNKPAGSIPERTHLCPRCTNPLIKDLFTCPHCSLEFKDKAVARKISLLYPGGGYFYTRHPFLGVGDAITEFYLSLLVLVALIAVVAGASQFLHGLILLSLVLALEKAITVYHSNRFVDEFIPKDRNVTVSASLPRQAPPKPAPPRQPTPQEILSASGSKH